MSEIARYSEPEREQNLHNSPGTGITAKYPTYRYQVGDKHAQLSRHQIQGLKKANLTGRQFWNSFGTPIFGNPTLTSVGDYAPSMRSWCAPGVGWYVVASVRNSAPL
jgi:hypothetical protein